MRGIAETTSFQTITGRIELKKIVTNRTIDNGVEKGSFYR